MNRRHFWLRSDKKYMVHWIFESKPVGHNVTHLIVMVTSLIVARVKFEPESSSSHESSSSQVKLSFFFLVVLFLIAV